MEKATMILTGTRIFLEATDKSILTSPNFLFMEMEMIPFSI